MPEQDGGITFMWKTADDGGPSFTGNCPALFKGPGRYYVQFKQVTDPAELAQLRKAGEANGCPLGPDEGYGWVPAAVIDRIRDL